MTEKDDYRAYLDSLKAGDKIQYVGSELGFTRVRHVCSIKIVRRTATQIICENQYGREERYHAYSGLKVGGSGFDILPRQASAEELAQARAECRQHNGSRKLEDHKWRDEPLEVIEAVLKLIKKKEETK